MSLTQRQRRIIAQAVARTSGNLSAAARWLKEYSVECPAVSRETIRRLHKDPGFAAMLREENTSIAQKGEGWVNDPEAWALPLVPVPEAPADAARFMHKLAWVTRRRIALRLSRPNADIGALLAFLDRTEKSALALQNASAPKVSALSTVAATLKAFCSAVGERPSRFLVTELLKLAHPEFHKIYVADLNDRASLRKRFHEERMVDDAITHDDIDTHILGCIEQAGKALRPQLGHTVEAPPEPSGEELPQAPEPEPRAEKAPPAQPSGAVPPGPAAPNRPAPTPPAVPPPATAAAPHPQ